MADLRELGAQHRVVLADHRIALFYECRGVADDTAERCAGVTFARIVEDGLASSWLDMGRVRCDGARSLAGRTLWQAEAPVLSPDLHWVASAILGAASDPDAQPVSRLRLTEHGLNLADGLYCPDQPATAPEVDKFRQAGLRLHLTKSAAHHLGLDHALPLAVKMESITFLPFRTGIGIAVVELRLVASAGRDPSLPQLIEAVHLLADERVARPPVFSFAGRPDKFRLSELLRSLLAGAEVRVLGDRRIYGVVAAVADGAIDAIGKREIAYRLSRHYNHVYDPDIERNGAVILTPFSNVTHVMSLEGVATLVDRPTGGPQALPEFLSNWLSGAHRSAYLPITIIAYHEYLALLELAQEAAIDLDLASPNARQARALERLCERFFAFRLRYRPAQISRITMHNEFSEHVRLALGNDRLGQKAAQDAAEAEQVIARNARETIERVERRRERRWAWHGALLGGLVALIAVMGLFDELSKAVSKFVPGATQEANIAAETGGRNVAGTTDAAVPGAAPPADAEAQASSAAGKLSIVDWIQLAGIPIGLFLGALGAIISWARLRYGEHAAVEIQNELMQQNLERRQKTRHKGAATSSKDVEA